MNTRRNQKSTDNNPVRKLEAAQLLVLKRMLDIQKTNAGGSIERVPDIPKMVLKKWKIHTFTRNTAVGQVLANSTTTPITYANSITLASLPNSAEFTSLFESYRIVQATWQFIPLFQGAVANALYTWFDYNDDSLPTGVAEGSQTDSLRISQSGHFVERNTVPILSQDGLANGTLTSGYSMPNTRLWVDTNSSGSKYYGIKAIIPANTNISNGVPLYEVQCNVVIQFKIPK